MSEHFHVFGDAVRRRFEEMSKGELYEVDATDMWAAYLAAYPEGSDPIFRTRSEHDCSCCKNFVRNVGHVVAVDEHGYYRTVWGVPENLPEPYNTVAAALDRLVCQLPIKGVFRTKQPTYGSESTKEQVGLSGEFLTWNHFSAKIASKHFTKDPEADAGRLNTGAQVMERQLRELKYEAVNTVANLIDEGQLYRGEEHKVAVQRFGALKLGYDALQTPAAKSAYAWRNAQSNGTAFRNSVIGGLVVTISEGEDLESAVRKFEAQVAPQNYKRPKALVTQRMIDEADETIQSLGLASALERRHARLSDVSVADVLWVDGTVKPAMKGGLSALLSSSAVKTQSAPHAKAVREISINEFVTEVVPGMTSLSVLLEPTHQRNLVSLTAPVDPTYLYSDQLFRWPGDLGWSYNGDVTDSVRERVKRAGGNVDAPLRVSLSWFNTDDLDLMAKCPDGMIYFFNKSGILDVDMNVSGDRRDAVENLSWASPRNGHYVVFVNNFTPRERVDIGFELEFHFHGETKTFAFNDIPKSSRQWGTVESSLSFLSFDYTNGVISNVQTHNGLVEGPGKGAEFWGVKSGVPVPVKTLMLSPNHASFDNGPGARHWFFALEGCLNPEPVRGIYNEFLRPELLEHKRVFELLGAKTKAPYSPDQVSGVGFTLGRNDSVTVEVRGDGVGGFFRVTF